MSSVPRAFGGALPTLALLGVTAAWGSTFFLIKDLLDEISVLDFLAIRFAIAGVVAVRGRAPRGVAAVARRRCGTASSSALRVRRRAGAADARARPDAGQRVRLRHRHVRRGDAALRGAVLLHEQIARTVWVAVVLVDGRARRSCRSTVSPSRSASALIFASAMLYALHIIGLGQWSRRTTRSGCRSCRWW